MAKTGGSLVPCGPPPDRGLVVDHAFPVYCCDIQLQILLIVVIHWAVAL